jgi:hypothetical protein
MERSAVLVTRSGLELTPATFHEGQVRISDIAWSLSTKHRYNGSAAWLYTVLQHEWLLSCHFNSDRTRARAALVHDSAEFLIGDMIRPLKHTPEMKPFRDLDDQITKVIYRRLGLDPELIDDPVIKDADSRICRDEMAVLCHHIDPSLIDIEPLGVNVTFKPPQEVYRLYMARFQELFPSYQEF